MPDIKVICLPTNQDTPLNRELLNLKRELAVKESEIVLLKAMKNQFIDRVAHDLRNPLGAILCFSELLNDEISEGPAGIQKEYLSTITNSTKYMLTLIDDLIDIAHMNTGNPAFYAGIIDIVSFVTDNITLNQPWAAEKKITIQSASSDTIIYVYADASRLAKVFNNLFSNAIKFSDPGTKVNVQITKESENVTIRISDSGIGIAPERQAKIFIPFEEVSRKGTSGEKGTGLGLAIAKRIIEEHGGVISLESTAGKGASFIVSLPLK